MQEFCHSVKLLICRAWSWLAACILKMHEFNRCLGLTTCRYCTWRASGTPQMQEFCRCPCFSTHITWTWLCSITLQIRDFISCLLLWTNRIWTWCAALCFAALIQPMQGISVTAWASQLELPSRGVFQEHHWCWTFLSLSGIIQLHNCVQTIVLCKQDMTKFWNISDAGLQFLSGLINFKMLYLLLHYRCRNMSRCYGS